MFYEANLCILCSTRELIPSWGIYFTFALERADFFPRDAYFTLALKELTLSSGRSFSLHPRRTDSLPRCSFHLQPWGSWFPSFKVLTPYSFLEALSSLESRVPLRGAFVFKNWFLSQSAFARTDSLREIFPSMIWFPSHRGNLPNPSSLVTIPLNSPCPLEEVIPGASQR